VAGASPELARLVRSMLAKDVLRRPAGAHELVAELVRLEIATFSDRVS
jgi:hypothetical protein